MNKLKIAITTVVFIISGFLFFYFRFTAGDNGYFTHMFYIPVILTAFWWQFWFIPVILLLVFLVFLIDLFFGHTPIIINDFVFFLIAGLTVSLLKNIQHNQLEQKIFRDILYSIQEAVVIIDQSFNIILTNDSFDRIFRTSHDKITNIYRLLKNNFNIEEFHENALRSFCGESIFMDSYIDGSDGKAGGYYNINLYPLKSENGIENLILTFRDVSEQKISEIQREKAAERQRISIEVLEMINRKIADSDTIHDILSLISRKIGIDVLAVILKPWGQYSKFASGNLTEALSEKLVKNQFDGCQSTNCTGIYISDSGIFNKISDDKLFWTNNLKQYLVELGYEAVSFPVIENYMSCAIIPLKNAADVEGYFILLDKKRDFFTSELIIFFHGIVESIEIALNRMQYELNLENMINEKELLLKEVHHRVKNNMQVIISLISLQASRQVDANLKEILNECQNRVRTMALVHEKLYSSDNFTSININAYIRSLVPMLMNSYRNDRTKICVDIDALDMFFSLSIAIPLAQLVNEILSNSFKHAFNEGIDGEVNIFLKPDYETGRMYRLTISDNGSGLPPDISYPNGNLGFQLIDALVKQIKGRIVFISNNGLTVDLVFSSD